MFYKLLSSNCDQFALDKRGNIMCAAQNPISRRLENGQTDTISVAVTIDINDIYDGALKVLKRIKPFWPINNIQFKVWLSVDMLFSVESPPFCVPHFAFNSLAICVWFVFICSWIAKREMNHIRRLEMFLWLCVDYPNFVVFLFTSSRITWFVPINVFISLASLLLSVLYILFICIRFCVFYMHKSLYPNQSCKAILLFFLRSSVVIKGIWSVPSLRISFHHKY